MYNEKLHNLKNIKHYLLSSFRVPEILGIGDTAVNETDKTLCLPEQSGGDRQGVYTQVKYVVNQELYIKK